MRRPAPTLPISSQQLKHFAAATVAITTLLALFAGGDDIGVAAQIHATQAKNDFIAAEQKKLGTKQLATHMKVKTGGGGFGEDPDGGFADGGGGGATVARSSMPKANPQGPAFLPPPGLSARADGKITRQSLAKPKGNRDQTDGRESDNGGDDPANSGRPDTSRLSNAIEASRHRSGSNNANDD